jgi:hypothetical protein
MQPKRVVVETVPAAEDEEKQASEGMELVARIVLGDTKRASESGLADFTCAVASGRIPEILNLMPYGIETVMDGVKGASANYAGKDRTALALSWMFKEASVAPVMSMLFASEFADMTPTLTKIAMTFDLDNQARMVKVASLTAQELRADHVRGLCVNVDASNTKKAAITPLALASVIEQVLSSPKADDSVTLEDIPDEEAPVAEPSVEQTDETPDPIKDKPKSELINAAASSSQDSSDPSANA